VDFTIQNAENVEINNCEKKTKVEQKSHVLCSRQTLLSWVTPQPHLRKVLKVCFCQKIKWNKNISHLVEFGSGRREKISNDFLPDYILNEMEKIVKILARNLSSKGK